MISPAFLLLAAVGVLSKIDMLEPKPRVPMGNRTTAQQANKCGGDPVETESPSNPRVKFSTLDYKLTFKTYDKAKRCNFFLVVGDQPDFDPIFLYDAATTLTNLKAGDTHIAKLDKINVIPEWVVGAKGTLQIECIEASRGGPVTHQCVDLEFDDPNPVTTVVTTNIATIATTELISSSTTINSIATTTTINSIPTTSTINDIKTTVPTTFITTSTKGVATVTTTNAGIETSTKMVETLTSTDSTSPTTLNPTKEATATTSSDLSTSISTFDSTVTATVTNTDITITLITQTQNGSSISATTRGPTSVTSINVAAKTTDVILDSTSAECEPTVVKPVQDTESNNSIYPVSDDSHDFRKEKHDSSINAYDSIASSAARLEIFGALALLLLV
ncbi:hypothetical protein BC833DRAFT_300376 [Globomyces pollinis-pini]|nr:hypothetical protein BC833DRAFT_300376 [Globomyces pollinis-pini]